MDFSKLTKQKHTGQISRMLFLRYTEAYAVIVFMTMRAAIAITRPMMFFLVTGSLKKMRAVKRERMRLAPETTEYKMTAGTRPAAIVERYMMIKSIKDSTNPQRQSFLFMIENRDEWAFRISKKLIRPVRTKAVPKAKEV